MESKSESSGQSNFHEFLNGYIQPGRLQQLWQEQHRYLEHRLDHRNLCSQLLDNLSGYEAERSAPETLAVSKQASPKAMTDERFQDPAWQHNPYFALIRKTYFRNIRHCEEVLEKQHFNSTEEERTARFAIRQLLNAMAPTNSVLSNPTVLREALTTEGRSLQQGRQYLLQDIAESPPELLKICQSDPDRFELGVDLAATPGQVIFENPLMQLIEYSAIKKTVYCKPLLIVPPFVNKFYVLDLDQRKSLVRWLVTQGYRVFMISWVNPDADLAHISLDDYIVDGVVAAIEIVMSLSGHASLNAAGYCTGGTLLAVAQAWLAARDRKCLDSLSLLTTQTDFYDPGALGVYMSEKLLPWVQKQGQARGVLDGRLLTTGFNLLRENELFWPYVINRYLLGRKPESMDILHWNNDSTNIPLAAMNQYVQAMYQENALIRHNSMQIKGTGIDLARIAIPAYCLATRKDHIVPWQSAFRSSRYLSGPVRFVLGGSGHVAGVINPANDGKYPHWVNERPAPDAQAWLNNASEVSGSWWKDWNCWLKSHSGHRIAAQDAGSAVFPPIEAAPGRYVRINC